LRILIGEKSWWGHGYGTEATELVVREAFERLGLDEVKLEVFSTNERAVRAYRRVGFQQTGEHREWVGRDRFELHVLEMSLYRGEFLAIDEEQDHAAPGASPAPDAITIQTDGM
jgi:RimJ/RimL family protein N-acetyltransferase